VACLAERKYVAFGRGRTNFFFVPTHMVCERCEDRTVKRNCATSTSRSLGLAYGQDLLKEINLTPRQVFLTSGIACFPIPTVGW
jgi:hypothetical protein